MRQVGKSSDLPAPLAPLAVPEGPSLPPEGPVWGEPSLPYRSFPSLAVLCPTHTSATMSAAKAPRATWKSTTVRP